MSDVYLSDGAYGVWREERRKRKRKKEKGEGKEREKENENFSYPVDRLGSVQWKNEKQRMQMTARHKGQVVHLKGDQTWGQITQRACGIFILADI